MLEGVEGLHSVDGSLESVYQLPGCGLGSFRLSCDIGGKGGEEYFHLRLFIYSLFSHHLTLFSIILNIQTVVILPSKLGLRMNSFEVKWLDHLFTSIIPST